MFRKSVLAILMVLINACKSAPLNNVAAKNAITRKPADSRLDLDPLSQMHSLSEILVELLPYYRIKSNISGIDAANLRKIVSQLQTLSYHVEGGGLNVESNPLFNSASKFLINETSYALNSLDNNNPETALKISKKIVGACITCHTQSESANRTFAEVWTYKTNSLSKLDLADFYVATRQYGKAMDAYNDALINSDLKVKDQNLWYDAAVRSVAVAIRVKNDPSLALEMISSLFDANVVPDKISNSAHYWRQALKTWRRENKLMSNQTNKQTATMLKEVGDSLNKIENSISSNKKPREFFLIERLRYSNQVNSLLKRDNLSNLQRAQAYFEAGRNSEYLEQVEISNPSFFYFQACIRIAPNSTIAKACYDRFREAYFREILSGNTSDRRPSSLIPELDELKSLSN